MYVSCVQFTGCVTITRFLGGINYLDVGDAVNDTRTALSQKNINFNLANVLAEI